MSARRWSQRSTKLPANGEMMMAGRLVKAKISAYCVVEPVRWYDQMPRLKPVKPEPVSDTSWPIHRRRKTSGRRAAGRESSLFKKSSWVVAIDFTDDHVLARCSLTWRVRGRWAVSSLCSDCRGGNKLQPLSLSWPTRLRDPDRCFPL